MCIINKLKNLISYCKHYYKQGDVDSDYYNGSENDLENIFLELIYHSNVPINVFNRIDYSARIKFLAEEGLHILNLNNVKTKSFKVTKNDIDSLVTKKITKKPSKKKIKENIKKAIKNYKKNVKSSVDI